MELKDIYASFERNLIRTYKEFGLYQRILYYSTPDSIKELNLLFFKKLDLHFVEFSPFIGNNVSSMFHMMSSPTKRKFNSIVNSICLSHWLLYAEEFLRKENIYDIFLNNLKSNDANDEVFKRFNSIEDYIFYMCEHNIYFNDFIMNSFCFNETKEGEFYWFQIHSKFNESIINCLNLRNDNDVEN